MSWRTLLAAFSRHRADSDLLAGPIRGELLGAEGLAEHARTVARHQHLRPPRRLGRVGPLLSRLDGTLVILEGAHARIAAQPSALDIGPAGEWLLDNFYVVRDHIADVRQNLPRGYYGELPDLSDGPLADYPRVYDLAIALISHSEGRLDRENIGAFTAAFQEVAPLAIGELWALPAMFRLGLVENVRRMALRTVQRLDQLDLADDWAFRLRAADASGPLELVGAFQGFIRDHPALTAEFVSRLRSQLRQLGGSAIAMTWLDRWLDDEGHGAEESATRTTQRLALTQVMMANSITSLRTLGGMDWPEFVEAQSVLEAALRQDPAEIYSRMTFETRDQYRHVVERLARRTGRPEERVARTAVELAQRNPHDGPAASAHVGFFLLGAGRTTLEQTIGYLPSPAERLLRAARRHPDLALAGSAMAVTAAALAAVLWIAGANSRPLWPLLVLLALLPANDVALNVIQQLVTSFLPPQRLPKLDFRKTGVPAGSRTAVVIPTLFSSVESVERALENLEVQFLANRGANLHFVVLGDFTDAPAEVQEDDAAIVQAAVAGVNALNARYGPGENAFYLLHRPRRFNPQQGVWMGWERKRGKLADFNHLVRGGAEGAFSVVLGDLAVLKEVRYVITLDADTVLPPETAPLLVGAMAHPLNRPDLDAAGARVVRGYGILQPRVGVSLPSANRTRFAAIYSGHPGVDPYTTAVSDLYQDLYGEGSFTGKGIYDVDAFERATHGRFPPNSLLSHDLIEGCFARAGLVTDVQVFDDYPSSYLTWTRRKHRWIRGDWQLIPWTRHTIPGAAGPAPNPLPAISLWKVIDNLRRSVVELAQLAFLVAGWTVLPGSPLRWTALWILVVAAPWIVTLLLGALRPPLDRSWRAYYAAIGRDAVTSARQLGLALVFLPHQAWISTDAIIRTLWRMGISRRRLLEWQTAFQSERSASASGRAVWRAMWPSVLLSAGLLLALLLRHGLGGAGTTDPRRWASVLVCTVLAGAWISAPQVAHWLGQSPRRRERRLAPALRADALRYALLHWKFFERFVTAETHWLAPDNVQEGPVPVVAMRTSPTNIGLQLLAITSAHDLGFLPLEEMISHLERVFASLERLPRFRGHFYNWYDLRDLRELTPAYVSTVDSGNLAGLLIAVRQACLSIPDEPVFDRRDWRAAETALGMVGATASAELEPKLRQVRSAVAAAERAGDVAGGLDAVLVRLDELEQAIAGGAEGRTPLGEAREWTAWTRRLVAEQRRRVEGLATGPGVGRLGEATRVFPTLRELSGRVPRATELIARLETLATSANRLASAMDFSFLYDRQRALFSIGYQPTSHTLDPSYYDLLASEARLASYVAIAKDDVPVDHWFHLGRELSRAAGETALMSWSGTMFEYLMPLLLMRSFPETLLDQTYRGAVRRQMAYGAGHSVPWGISESAYNVRDRFGTYQYRAFGVPDLALKRGLDTDLVVAPYASTLAAMVEPTRALPNLKALERRAMLGPYGFRDALDYTRPDPGKAFAVVETFMAHHLGMGLGALTNVLSGQIWQRRFHADPLVRAAELLLYERIPRRMMLQKPQTARPEASLPSPELEAPAVRELDTPLTPQPRVALLGRLPYTVMLTNGGSGYSRYEDLAVTRWRADGTADSAGQHCYVKDVTRGRIWSTAHQPVCARADTYHVSLATDRVVFHRTDGPIETRTEITTVPDDSAEVRRVTVTNNGAVPCDVELTSYGELVLAPPDADRAHPAFGNLFVETEWHSWCSAVTGTRRPRAPSEQRVWCTHVVATGEERVGPITCETDRSRFLGRGRSPRLPAALDDGAELSGTTGAVIDPIFALRCRLRLQPGRSASAAFTTLVTTTAERTFELADRYRDPRSAERALELAWTAAQIELRELNTSSVDAGVFQQLAGALFFSDPRLRSPEAELLANQGSQPMLWAIGLSGDWPILLATIESAEGLPTLRQLLAAHQYWRRRGMMVDSGAAQHPSLVVPGGPRGAGDGDRPLLQRGGNGRPSGRSLPPTARPPRAGRAADAPRHRPGAPPVRRPSPRSHPGVADRCHRGGEGAPSSAAASAAAHPRRPGGATARPTAGGERGTDSGAGASRGHRGRERGCRGRGAPPHGQRTRGPGSPRGLPDPAPRRGPSTRAVDERGGQPARRLRRLGAGSRLQLGRQQLLLPVDALAQRSGVGSDQRRPLPPGRGLGRAVDPHSRPHPSCLGVPDPPRHRRFHVRAPTFRRGEPLDHRPRREFGHADLATAPDQPWQPDAPHRGDGLRRVDAGEPARAHPASDPHRVRCRPGDPLRPEHLRPSVRRLGGLLRARPGGARAHGRPARVPRPPRKRLGTGGNRASERSRRCSARPVRGAPVQPEPRSRGEPGGGGLARGRFLRGPGAGGGRRSPRLLAGGRRARRDRHRLGAAALGPPGAYSRARLRCPAQPLAAVPGAFLPDVGPLGPVPEQRGVRIPRSAPGFDGVPPRRSGRRPGSPPPRRRQAVRRGRCAALVASGERPRGAHAVLRRSGLAALRGGPLRDGHRRPRCARRAASLSDHANAPAGRAGGVRPPATLRRGRESLRALPPGAQEGQHPRRPRAPADRLRRLERRDEPGGGGRPGESVWLAWFLAATLRSFAEQATLRGDVAVAAELREHGGELSRGGGGARLGRRLVPARIRRRRRAARVAAPARSAESTPSPRAGV